MNRLPFIGLIVALFFLSSGCASIEESRLCTGITPHIYCQNEMPGENASPISLISLWEPVKKRKNPDEAKIDAWVGGNGVAFEIIGVDKLKSPYLIHAPFYFYSVQKYMLGAGFRYTGTCDAEIPIICHAQKKHE